MTTPIDRAAEAPMILGVPLTKDTRNGLSCWFGELQVLLLWRERGGYDSWISGFRVHQGPLQLPDCIAAIERELLAIRYAIPVATLRDHVEGDATSAWNTWMRDPENAMFNLSSPRANWEAGYRARAAEPPQPAELGHVATVRRIADRLRDDGYVEQAHRILEREGLLALVLATPEFDEPAQPGRVGGAPYAALHTLSGILARLPYVVERDVAKAAWVEVLEAFRGPAEPRIPTNEELIATARRAIEKMLVRPELTGPGERASEALSDLERRLAVKP